MRAVQWRGACAVGEQKPKIPTRSHGLAVPMREMSSSLRPEERVGDNLEAVLSKTNRRNGKTTMKALVVVTGAGGAIGGHLVAALRQQNVEVRAIDIKPLNEWYQLFPDVENIGNTNLQEIDECLEALEDATDVYNLAAAMGGMGYIESHKAECMLNVLIDSHLLIAAREAEVQRFFFSSSACVYAQDKQRNPNIMGLRESDAYPADPEDGYGWSKLFTERLCRHFYDCLLYTSD